MRIALGRLIPDSFLIKRESWAIFFLKGGVVLSILWLAGVSFSKRFYFAVDSQTILCIPEYRVYLVDKADTIPKKGSMFVFASKDLMPFYPSGTKLLKYMRGMPGDRIKIQNNGIEVNGAYAGFGLSLAKEKLGRNESDFEGETVLSDNQYWMMGTSSQSFDSRYWGPIQKESIIGRAYPIF